MKYISDNKLLASMQITLKMYEDKILKHKEAMESLSDGFKYEVKFAVYNHTYTKEYNNDLTVLRKTELYCDSANGFAEVYTNNQRLVDYINSNWGDVFAEYKDFK